MDEHSTRGQSASKRQRIYRALLRLLPFEFRAEFGQDMEQTFRDEHDDIRARRSVAETVAFWLRTARDVARTAPREHWDVLRQDLRLGARLLVRNRGFAATAIVTLALGIGGSASIFSVVYAVVMRPLAFPESEPVVRIGWTGGARDSTINVSYSDFASLREKSRTLDLIGVVRYDNVSSEKGSLQVPVPGSEGFGTVGPASVPPWMASAAVFEIFGVSTVIGRLPEARDEEPGAPPVAVLSYRTWTSLYGRDPEVLGRTLVRRLGSGNKIVTIVGVLNPDAFGYGETTKNVPVWTSFDTDVARTRDNRGRETSNLSLFARVAPGVSIETAGAEVTALSAPLAAPSAESPIEQASLHARLLRNEIARQDRDSLMAFLWAVASLLLIACVNVASLMLARALSRRQEFAARFALGARPLRIARQLFTESAILALAAGALGLALAWAGQRAFVAISPSMPRLDQSSIGWPALLFTFGGVLLATCIASLVPTLQASRRGVVDGLRRASGTPSTVTAFSKPLGILGAIEVALVLVLLAGTGLLVNSFARLTLFDLGLDARSIVMLTLDATAKQPPAIARASHDDVVRRLSAIPGVVAVGVTGDDPFGPPYRYAERFQIEGTQIEQSVGRRIASPAALDALGMQMAAGRWFTERDDESGPAVAIVNQTMARKYWSGRSPLGERIVHRRRVLDIIGVVADVHERGARQDVSPTFYTSTTQTYPEIAMLVVRTRPSVTGVEPAISAELARIGTTISGRPRRLEDVLWGQLADARFLTIVLSVFTVLALVVALVGVHGILRFLVTHRTRELGIRRALGATRRDLLALVLGQALRFALPGCAIGLAAAVAAGPAIRSLLFGIEPADLFTLMTATALLIAAVVVGAYFPARRASNIDPALSLRSE